MIIFSIPVLLIFVTVSEQQQRIVNFDDSEITLTNLDGNYRRINRQRHPEYEDLVENDPCLQRRSMSHGSRYKDSPIKVNQDTFNQWQPVTVIPVSNQEFKIPAERFVSQQQPQQIQKISPEQVLQTPSAGTPGKVELRIPVKSNKHVDQTVPEQIDTHKIPATYVPQTPKPQTIQVDNLGPGINSKYQELPDYLKHNEAIPSHKDPSYFKTMHVPNHNQKLKPHSFFDLFNHGKNNSNIRLEPSMIQENSYFTSTQKQMTKEPELVQQVPSEPVSQLDIKRIPNKPVKDTEVTYRSALKLINNTKPEEIADHIIGHNEGTPSHIDPSRLEIFTVPQQNITTKPTNFFDLFNMHNESEVPVSTIKPTEDRNINPKTQQLNKNAPDNCILNREGTGSVDHLPESRRSLSQDGYSGTDTNLSLEQSYQILDPTKGAGISTLSESRRFMLEGSKVCYACSTLSDASCWIPDRTTTVKYCRAGHNVCVTKSYKSTAGSLIVIRDCSSSCDVPTPGLDTHYDSCAVCKEDLCNNLYVENSAISLNPLNLLILIFAGFITHAFKD